MNKTKKWAPNPYALAQLLADRSDVEFLYNADGKRADEFLLGAFRARDRQRTLADALGLFEQLSEAVDRPMSLSQVMELAQAKLTAQAFTVEQVQRALLYLVPLTDAEFAALEDETSRPGQSTRTWFGDSGELMIDDASYLDPIQGAVGNCYLISSMIALAWAKPASWEAGLRSARFNPPQEPAFEWQFHGDRGRERGRIKVSGRIPVKAKRKPRYARSASGESWPGLVEKAYVVKMRGTRSGAEPTLSDYQAIDRGSMPPRACQALAGGRVRGQILAGPSDAEIFSLDAGLITASGVINRPVMAWTKEDIGVTDPKVWEKTGLWPNHAYAVLGTMPSKHVVLRNPHGVATEVRSGYAVGTWDPDDRETIKLNKNGVFAISRALFFRHFGNIGWVEHPSRPRGGPQP